jgi:hypothetical protein
MSHTIDPSRAPVSEATDVEKERLAEKFCGASLSSTSEQKMRTGPEAPLYCSVDFAIYPLGTTIPYSKYIDQVELVLKELGERRLAKQPVRTSMVPAY